MGKLKQEINYLKYKDMIPGKSTRRNTEASTPFFTKTVQFLLLVIFVLIIVCIGIKISSPTTLADCSTSGTSGGISNNPDDDGDKQDRGIRCTSAPPSHPTCFSKKNEVYDDTFNGCFIFNVRRYLLE